MSIQTKEYNMQKSDIITLLKKFALLSLLKATKLSYSKEKELKGYTP